MCLSVPFCFGLPDGCSSKWVLMRAYSMTEDLGVVTAGVEAGLRRYLDL